MSLTISFSDKLSQPFLYESNPLDEIEPKNRKESAERFCSCGMGESILPVRVLRRLKIQRTKKKIVTPDVTIIEKIKITLMSIGLNFEISLNRLLTLPFIRSLDINADRKMPISASIKDALVSQLAIQKLTRSRFL